MKRFKNIISLFFFCISFHCCADAPKAIIIGASSGMGREVAKLLSKEGYILGLAARRVPLLESLQDELEGPSIIQPLDVTDPEAQDTLQELLDIMGQVDLVLISISAYLDIRESVSDETQEYNAYQKHDWAHKELILDVDCKGFIAMAEVALAHFKQHNKGHLVGISSTSGLHGSASCPVYSGAKACLSRYMQGIRHAMKRDYYTIDITDVVPGFVAVEHSPLGQDPNAFWEITVEQAGREILAGIKNKEKVVYVPTKVQLLTLLDLLPDSVYEQFFNWR